MSQTPRTINAEGWYFILKGESVGPIAFLDLQNRLFDGRLSLTTLTWCDGMPDWATAESLGLHLVASPARAGDAIGNKEDRTQSTPAEITKESFHLEQTIQLSSMDQPHRPDMWEKAGSINNPFVREAGTNPGSLIERDSDNLVTTIRQIGEFNESLVPRKDNAALPRPLAGMLDESNALEELDEMAPKSQSAAPFSESKPILDPKSAAHTSMQSPLSRRQAFFSMNGGAGRSKNLWAAIGVVIALLGGLSYLKFSEPKGPVPAAEDPQFAPESEALEPSQQDSKQSPAAGLPANSDKAVPIAPNKIAEPLKSSPTKAKAQIHKSPKAGKAKAVKKKPNKSKATAKVKNKGKGKGKTKKPDSAQLKGTKP